MTSVFAVCVIFYLIGSIPTAYILVKIKYKKNLIKEGSGNIGARNTYDVTNSRLDGIIVLIADFLKGFLPAIWFACYSGIGVEKIILPAVFLILGHNYSVWIKFKGGRGLATGAGIMAVLNFSPIIIWLIFCAVFYFIYKNIHVANVISLILMPISFFLFYDFLSGFNSGLLSESIDSRDTVIYTNLAVCLVILMKHISPLKEYFIERGIKKKN
ncbi:MAG: Glycerol-3-phosphate acyltransferase [Ignavibacteria bacterium]|nr:Glycerol-3-phosphate acyltransferase [Ignavibacteria bacterium]